MKEIVINANAWNELDWKRDVKQTHANRAAL